MARTQNPITTGRVLRAISWNTAATTATWIVTFFRSLVLARLLTPADYGLFGLAAIVMMAVTAFTSLNLTSSIIPRQAGSADERRKLLNTVWTVELARQLITTLVLLASAYPAAKYFRDDRVFPVLLVVAFSPFVSGFTNVGLVLFRQGIEFKKLALQQFYTESTTTVIVLVVAFYVRSVWALVFGNLLGSAMAVAFSYVLHPYRPRFAFDRSVLAPSLAFSKNLLLIGILTFLTTQFDNLVVGRYLGAAVLGAYLLAYRLANLAADIVSDVVGSVMFPTFAALRSSSERAAPALVSMIIALHALFLAVGLSLRLTAADVIHLLFGTKWDAAAPLLAVLCFQGALRGMTRSEGPFLLGCNRADLDAKAKVVETAVFVVLTVVLVAKLGAVGAAYAGILCYLIAAVLRLVFVVRLLPVISGLLIRRLAQVIAAAAASYGAGVAALNLGCHSYGAAAIFLALFTGITFLLAPELRHVLQAILREAGPTVGSSES